MKESFIEIDNLRVRTAIKRCLVLFLFFLLGGCVVLTTAQIILSYIDKYKSVEYTDGLLKRTNDIYNSVHKALDTLNKDKNKDKECSETLKTITYDYRFIEDSGKIDGNIIICSAMNGIKKKILLDEKKIISYNSTRVWFGVDNYITSKQKVRIIAMGDFFVVVSPNAFNAYRHPPENTNTKIFHTKQNITSYEFNSNVKNKHGFTLKYRKCSSEFPICIESKTYSNILKSGSPKLLAFLTFMSMLVGLTSKHYVKKIIQITNSIPYRLKSAIDRDLISVAYQPIVIASSGEIKGFEVLARWYDNKIGQIPPDVFIKESEKINLYNKLNKNILKKAINEIKEVLANNKSLYISLNVQTHEIISFEIIKEILELIQKNNINPSQIAIELLEGSTSDLKSIEKSIYDIKSYGLKVFIDDFGTGYSSLAYLSKIKVDSIKIDKTFTQSAGTKSPASFVLLKICEIANNISASVIFEGVENNNQKEFIISSYPNALAQGWLYSKAVDITTVENLLRKKQ